MEREIVMRKSDRVIERKRGRRKKKKKKRER